MDYKTFFIAYRPLLYKYLSLLYSKDLEWEDWKQQGELILLELLRKYDPKKGNLSSYLKKTLYYSLMEYKKKISRNTFEIIEENYSQEDEKRKIKLTKLSKRQKEIIKLFYFVGLSERDIAKRLKISRRSVRTHKKRALAKLRSMKSRL
ncbi:MAG: sigma-70 family RNA polymerase sigma factor [Dictyoglomaceae bacterium]